MQNESANTVLFGILILLDFIEGKNVLNTSFGFQLAIKVLFLVKYDVCSIAEAIDQRFKRLIKAI